ncbi:MAG: DUF362 domain-containing protein [Candidatus Omnitrophica bacterium]|nr:DUF362 domain-containing protein [Candidatus Omnitrophota bacterium]
MPKSIVYFQPVDNSRDKVRVAHSFKNLIKISGLLNDFKKGELVPIKMHLGEKGNTGHVGAKAAKVAIDKIKSVAAKPFITETNVLYQGSRVNAVDHLMLASVHGFDPVTLGAPVIISDGFWGENAMDVKIDKKHFESVNIARPVMYFDSIVSIAHVTGHMLTGVAASLKNMGMGLASRTGKLKQHSNIKPHVKVENCTFCKRCIKHCPVEAIIEKDEKAFIKQDACIGCAECISVCKFGAIADDYGEDAKVLSEKMVEYAYGVLLNIKKKVFFNFALHITKNCDCMAKDEPFIVDDIGIFASSDPVACDKAAADMVVQRASEDIFKKVYPQADFYMNQLIYAQSIGLGKMDYELVIAL